MKSQEFYRAGPLSGKTTYGPYRLALDPTEMDRYLRQARIERAQVACDLVNGLYHGLCRGVKRLAPGHRGEASIGGHLPSAR